jgi:hypothetical protein
MIFSGSGAWGDRRSGGFLSAPRAEAPAWGTLVGSDSNDPKYIDVRRVRRQEPGVRPVCCRNCLLRCAWSVKPHCSAISLVPAGSTQLALSDCACISAWESGAVLSAVDKMGRAKKPTGVQGAGARVVGVGEYFRA